MTKISLLGEASDLNGDEQVVLVKDGVTRRAAVSGLVGASVGPYLEQADASAMAAALARDQAADLVLPVNIFVDVPLAAAEADVAVGESFKLVDTGTGLVGVRRRTPDGSVLMYQEATAAALASKDGETILGSDDGASGALWNNIRGFIAYLRSSVGSSIIGFLPAGVGAIIRSLQAKMRDTVSVMDFGAVGDGVADDTEAFNKAIATGKAVTVPAFVWNGSEFVRAQYLVENIHVVGNMHIVGEKKGWADAPLLIVKSSGASAFLSTSSEILFYPVFENLACTTSIGKTGTSFYKQTRSDRYTAFPTFNNIETHLELTVSYIISPIYATFNECGDGRIGGYNGVSHTAVSALADEYGQRDQFNVVTFNSCIFNNAFGGLGCIVASYGVSWKFNDCGFEAMTVSVFTGYNVRLVQFDGGWIEKIRAANTIQLREYPGTAASSSGTLRNVNVVFNGTEGVPVEEFLGLDPLSTASVEGCEFNLVPAGAKLTNTGDRLTVAKDNKVLSGPGAAAFFDGTYHDTYTGGRRLLNGATYNGVSGMSIQNAGGISATQGFLSTTNMLIGDAFVTIATSQTGFGAAVRISGFDSVDGSQFRFIKDFFSGVLIDIVAPVNNSSRIFSFQVVDNALQMKVDAGKSVRVTVTIIH